MSLLLGFETNGRSIEEISESLDGAPAGLPSRSTARVPAL
jgi:hypothetical protein